MKWIGQHIYDLVARFRNDVYLEDLSTTTETNVLVVDSDGKVSKTTVITGGVTGVTAGSNITVTDPNGPTPTVAVSTNPTFTNAHVAGTLDVTNLGTFDASITVDGKISLNNGGDSVFVGEEAGLNDDGNGRKNVGVGYKALSVNTIGSYSVAVGHMASYANTGSANTAVGAAALQAGVAGGYNTALGFSALSYNTTGSFNIAIGVDAGKNDAVTTNGVTNNSVFLGSNTKALLSGQTNQIVIGYGAVGLGSNTAILGNSYITKTQLQGNVGIGTAAPVNKLDIVGSLGRGAPVIKTGNFTVASTENWLIINGTATITITLPTASDWTGRELMIKNINDYQVVSASSNVKPILTDTAGSAILGARAPVYGAWCTLVSDGTNWVTMMSS
jgi:hypothetical protein